MMMQRNALLLALFAAVTLTAQNLVRNPAFDGNPPAGWRLAGAQCENGVAAVAKNPDGSNGFLEQTLKGPVKGRRYRISCEAMGEPGSLFRFCAYWSAGNHASPRKRASDNWKKHQGNGKWVTLSSEITYDADAINDIRVSFVTFEGKVQMRHPVVEEMEQPPELPSVQGGRWSFHPTAAGVHMQEGQPALVIKFAGSLWTPAAEIKGIPIKPGQRYRLRYEALGIGQAVRDTGFHGYRVELSVPDQGYSARRPFEEVWASSWQGKSALLDKLPTSATSVDVRLFAESGCTVAFRNFSLEEYTPPITADAQLILTSPLYRDSIYASLPVKELTGHVLMPPDVRNYRVRLEQGGKALASVSRTVDCSFVLPASELTEGEATVIAEGLSDKNDVLRTVTRKLRKLPPAAHEMVMGPNRIMYFDGVPFLPTMLMGELPNDDFAAFASAHGLNSFLGRSGTAKGILALLEMARRHGLKMMLGYTYAKDGNLASFRQRAQRLLSAEVTAHPSLLGYFLADEPFWTGANLDYLRESYNILRERDPYHPVWINSAPPSTLEENRPYMACADINGFDVYPVPYPCTHSFIADKYPTALGKYSQLAFDTSGGRHAVWMVHQAHSWKRYIPGKPDSVIYPNLDELRFMCFDSLLHQASGVIYWGSNNVVEPQFLRHVLASCAEVESLSRLLAEGRRRLLSEQDDLAVHELEFGGLRWLAVLNCSTREREVSFPAPCFGNGLVTVFHEQRKVECREGVLQDRFRPYSVHLYGVAPLPPAYREPPLWQGKNDPLEEFCRRVRDPGAKYAGTANWLWEESTAATVAGKAFLRRHLKLDAPVKSATILASVDDYASLTVNGQPCASFGGWSQLTKVDITHLLRIGDNLMLVEAEDAGHLPCAFLAEIHLEHMDGQSTVIITDDQWESAATEDGPWHPAKVIAPYGQGAWGRKVQLP
ncbi:MAG: hypothetical protein IJJ33_15720 [Victivallales bacterium]|nr:hypothetical protein [Victivallales bacterium]